MNGLILYGPPASGKDTVSAALVKADTRFRVFRRLKVGAGKTATYRMTTPHELEGLRQAGHVVWENQRYGATYVVDLPELRRMLGEGIPILHLGQVEAIDTIRRATPEAHWLTVWLHCPRDVAHQRLRDRDPRDVDARLTAWDDTAPLDTADLTINTGTLSPAESAATILTALRRSMSSGMHEPPSGP